MPNKTTTHQKYIKEVLVKKTNKDATYSETDLYALVNIVMKEKVTDNKYGFEESFVMEYVGKYMHYNLKNNSYTLNFKKKVTKVPTDSSQVKSFVTHDDSSKETASQDTNDTADTVSQGSIDTNKTASTKGSSKKLSDVNSNDTDSIIPLDSDSDSVCSSESELTEAEKEILKAKMLKMFTTGQNKRYKKTEYQYPEEKDYKPVKRENRENGPYGAQWIHEKQVHDKFGDIENKRAKQYDYLRGIPLPEQRTPEWFAMRDKKITASDGGCVVNMNKHEAQYQFIHKKVFGKKFSSNMFCYHGKKYEEIASMSYAYRMNVQVEEFGLMGHKEIDFLGASPDNICNHYKFDGKHKSKYVGRMIEIKCPLWRKIKLQGEIKDEICPIYYWVQVQLQLECCDLDECDFWQCDIKEYYSKNDFIADTNGAEPFRSKETGLEKGVVIQLLPKNKVALLSNLKEGKIRKQIKNKFTGEMMPDPEDPGYYLDEVLKEHIPGRDYNDWKRKESKGMKLDWDLILYNQIIYDTAVFIYPPKIEMTPLECDVWITDVIQNLHRTHPDLSFDRTLYWKLVLTHNVTINRDRKWFKEYFPVFKDAWNSVLFFREHKDYAEMFQEYIDNHRYVTPKSKNADVMAFIKDLKKNYNDKKYIKKLKGNIEDMKKAKKLKEEKKNAKSKSKGKSKTKSSPQTSSPKVNYSRVMFVRDKDD